ncbi:MAG: FKBP-type peptidyl-prolyl cis-trans isomerase [Alphaproteobacteria bacterium]|nr:FKBP-type peptidyl-prolyl cis-trans isomerase [Alphaproteobacteria bacterium]
MSFGRFAAFPVVVLAGMSLSACVFSLGGDEPKPKVRASEACPARDDANWAKMQAYLDANKAKAGVTTTESGLQYRVLQPPAKETARKPTWASTVQVRYRGTLIDGTVFDETKAGEPPAEFEAGGVIKGWQEALTTMREGEKWEVVIPSELAYGCKGKGQIKPDQVLVFEIDLLKIK